MSGSIRLTTLRSASLLVTAAFLACHSAQAAIDRGPIANLPDPTTDIPLSVSATQDTAYFAGGCFWGIQAVFQHVTGVIAATSGYAGGTTVKPSYDEVSSGDTGHAESVRVVYDPSKVTYGVLLKVFFSVAHDPTELNRQGPDVGTQYRSAIFYRTAEQQGVAEAYVKQLTEQKAFDSRIVTQITALKEFFVAEDYHQDYATLHPDSGYIMAYDAPKIEALKVQFPTIWSEKKAGS